MNAYERTARALAILDLRAAGFTAKEIADVLDINVRTVYRVTKTVTTSSEADLRE